MDKQQFIGICSDLKENIEKVIIPKTDHLQKRTLRSGLQFADDSVRSQYMELINPSMHLAKVTSKLGSLGNIVHDKRYIKYGGDNIDSEEYARDTEGNVVAFSQDEDGVWMVDDFGDYALIDAHIDARELADTLIRYCELNRKEKIYGYKHMKSGLVFGIVSPRHKLLYDLDGWDVVKNIFENIPHTYQFTHSTFRMTVNIVLDAISVHLGGTNSIKYRMTFGNSMFGVGSAFITAGSFEQWCGNGAMGWRVKMRKEWKKENIDGVFDWRKAHIVDPATILRGLETAITSQLKHGDKYMGLIREAHEVNEPIFKENEDIIETLRKEKYGLLKTEAEQVYKLMKIKHEQYGRFNAFDTGRAIAEVARDTMNHDRCIELEQIAGHTMLAQIN